MKQLKLILILFIVILKSFGQNIKPSELIKMSTFSKETFDSYMQIKGYQLNKTSNNDEGFNASYLYQNKDVIRFCSHREYKDGKILITYETYDNTDYNFSRETIKKFGFKLVKTKTLDDGALVFHFRKGNDIFALISWVENGRNAYEIAYKKNYYSE